jgi:Domain of unknown function (DUF4258)
MSADIITFALTREAALRRIRLFMEQGAFEFDPHLRESMLERDISMRQVMTTVREGSINQGPTMDEYGEWRCRLRKRTAGRLVRVVVAIQPGGLLFVTTF